jgi:nucleoside-diphosphate-sugar epimerase
MEQTQPVAVIHTAGMTDVRLCLANPAEALEVNVLQTARLLDAIRLRNNDGASIPLIYVATDKSFGDQTNCGLETAFKPQFPYDVSKACEDMTVESYRKTYGLLVSTLRFPNFYGPDDTNDSRLLPSLFKAAISQSEFIVRTKLQGSTRQYIYVRDAAEIIVHTMRKQLAGLDILPVSHFGPSVIKSVGDVISDFNSMSGIELSVRELNQSSETNHLSLRDQNAMGFSYTDWLIGLKSSWDSYRNRATDITP